MPYNKSIIIVGALRKVVTSVDVYKEIRRLQLEGITSQRAAAKRLGISRNTVKKYWEGNAFPWEHKDSREAFVMTPDEVQFISGCLMGQEAVAWCSSYLLSIPREIAPPAMKICKINLTGFLVNMVQSG